MTWRNGLRHAAHCFRLGKEAEGEISLLSYEADIPQEPHLLEARNKVHEALDRCDFLAAADIIEYKLM